MKPLPVLILVLIAIAATVTAVLLFRGPDGNTTAVAPTPVERTDHAAADPAVRIEGPRSDVTRENTAPAPTTDENPDEGVVNNRLVGVVLNDKEQPLQGATVKLSQDAMMGEALAMDFFTGREASGKFLSTQTDAQGKYVFRAVDPGRNYYLMAQHPEYSAVQEEGLRIGKTGEIRAPDLVLRAGSRLHGVVVDVEGGSIADAVLDLDSAYMMGMEMKSPDRITVKTDANGNYEFRNVPPGPRILSCGKEGFEHQIQSDLLFSGEPGEQVERNFKLGLGHPIAGRVFGPENEGVKGAIVTAMNYGANNASRSEAVTDDDGNFQIDGLSQGAYMLMIQAVGYRQMRQNRVQVGDLNVQVEMIKQNTLTGHVYEIGSNKPVQNFRVQVLRVNTSIPQQGSQTVNYEPTTVKLKVEGSADGAFSLPGVDPGQFALKINAAGFASKVTDNFTVVDGQVQPQINVYLSKGGTIRGRVVDAATGKPVSGVQVSSKDGDAPGGAVDPFFEALVATRATESKVRTNADGFFELKLLNPGRYRLQLEHVNYTTEWVQNVIVMEDQVADAGSTALHPGGTVSGKVVDGAGKPCTRAQVRLFNDAGDVYDGRTDGEGRYSIEHVKPGLYRVSAARSAGANAAPFDDLLDQQNSEVQVQVLEGQTASRDLTLGN